METFELLPQRERGAMRIALGLNAISFLSQLSEMEAWRLSESLERLAGRYDELQTSRVRPVPELQSQGGRDLRTYGAEDDVSVFFYVESQTIYVVDIARSRQLERMRALRGNAA